MQGAFSETEVAVSYPVPLISRILFRIDEVDLPATATLLGLILLGAGSGMRRVRLSKQVTRQAAARVSMQAFRAPAASVAERSPVSANEFA